MRVNAIRNYGLSTPIVRNKKMSALRQEITQAEAMREESLSFKGRVGTGAGVGALLGLGAMGLISALSGGLAAPIAYGVYAAVGGVAGGMAGDALDRADAKNKKDS